MGAVLDLTKKRAEETSLPGEPPCAARAEELVIEACLVVPGLLQRVSPPLMAEHFFQSHTRTIFDAIQEVQKENGEVNSLSVMNWLRLKKKDGPIKPDMVHTRSMFSNTELSQVVSAAKIVFELAQERSLITLCQQTAAKILDRKIESHRAAFTEFGAKTTDLCRVVMRGTDTISGEAAARAAIREALAENGDAGTLTGLREYDFNVGAMLLGQYTLIGGPSGDGKTAYGLTVASNVARQGAGVFYVAVADMTAKDLMLRIVCSWAGVPAMALMRKKHTAEQAALLMRAAPEANNIPIEIDDTPGQSIQEIDAQVPRVKAKFERVGVTLRLVVIDYLQQVGFLAAPKGWNEEQRLREISQCVKNIAVKHNVHALGLAQAHPAPPKSKESDGRPNDFQNCKEMRRPAEIVGFIHRLKDDSGLYPPRGKAEIVIRKARWGSKTNVRVVFNGPLTRFENDPDEYSGGGGIDDV